MERFIILRKHMLVKSYVVIKDGVTATQLAEFMDKISSKELEEYKFIKGNFVIPTVTYNVTSFEDEVVPKEEPKKDTVAQRIFAKYSQGSSLYENNQGAF